MESNSKQKDLGQVWTPLWAVNRVLDEAGFANDKVLNKKILEPSFGEGVFIKEISSRIIIEANNKKYSDEEIISLVDNFVFGVEYDAIVFDKTLSEIKEWAFQKFGLVIPFSNLYKSDALDFEEFNSFDFVVGNPPYVRVHNLPQDMRDKIKAYAHSTGTTDLYLIFYELGIKWLNDSGVLSYIAPNSWMRNASQKNFRAELVERKLISKITDFGKVKVFSGISTYTSIVVLDKNCVEEIVFKQMSTENTEDYKVSIPISYLEKHKGAPFNFLSHEDYSFIRKTFKEDKPLIQDYYKVQNGVATLGDKLFLLDETASVDFEEKFIAPVVKASTYKGEPTGKKIIFPYKALNGKYVGVEEKELINQAPKLNEYFNGIKDSLIKRSFDKGSLWFWYGRSQAIQETGKRKLVLSPLIGPDQASLKTYIVPEGTVVYSGILITELNKDYPLEKIKKTIESKKFARYCKLYGKDMSGNYKSISAPMIKNYPM